MGLCFNDVGQALQPPLCQRMHRLQPKKMAGSSENALQGEATKNWALKKGTFAGLSPSHLSASHCASATAKASRSHNTCTTTGNDKRLLTCLQLETIQIIQGWQLHPECDSMPSCISYNVNLCSTFQRGSQNNKALARREGHSDGRSRRLLVLKMPAD